MLELHLFIKPLTGAVFRLVLQRNPWHQKGIPLKASEILQWCDWQGFFFLGFLVHVNSGGKSGNKGWVWFIATKFPTPVTGASALLHCTFFSEKHIQLLSFKVLWLEKKRSAHHHPPSLFLHVDLITAEAEDRKVVSVPAAQGNYLVTWWMAWARYATLPEVTPATEMRPSFVM